MNWIETTSPGHKGKVMISDCKTYLISNSGKRGGEGYCLWEKRGSSYCGLLAMGTFNEVKASADDAEKAVEDYAK